jgi:hypothetical protein
VRILLRHALMSEDVVEEWMVPRKKPPETQVQREEEIEWPLRRFCKR